MSKCPKVLEEAAPILDLFAFFAIDFGVIEDFRSRRKEDTAVKAFFSPTLLTVSASMCGGETTCLV